MPEEAKVVQCSGVKSDGTRCTREKEVEVIEQDEWRCWQHQDDKEINNNQQHKKEGEKFGAIKNVKQRSFLVAFSQLGNISKAANRSQVDRSSHYKWIDPKHQLYDSTYQEAFKVAQKIAVEYLEAEARRRAVEGIEEPVFYKGEIVGHRMRYSDTLLMFLLKGNAPEKYKDRVEQQHTGEVKTKGVDLSHLSSEELQKIVDEL